MGNVLTNKDEDKNKPPEQTLWYKKLENKYGYVKHIINSKHGSYINSKPEMDWLNSGGWKSFDWRIEFYSGDVVYVKRGWVIKKF
jgi:hypothetical protein